MPRNSAPDCCGNRVGEGKTKQVIGEAGGGQGKYRRASGPAMGRVVELAWL